MLGNGGCPRYPRAPMAVNFLDFEQPIAELEAKIEELKHVPSGSAVNIQEEITRLQAKSEQLTQNIFANLTPWQITQLARHPQRRSGRGSRSQIVNSGFIEPNP